MKPYQSHISLSVSADDHRINASRCVKTFGVTLDDEWVSVSDLRHSRPTHRAFTVCLIHIKFANTFQNHKF